MFYPVIYFTKKKLKLIVTSLEKKPNPAPQE